MVRPVVGMTTGPNSSCTLSPFWLSSTATQRVAGTDAKMMAIITVTGTEISIPTGPQRKPQKDSETRMISGDRFRDDPRKRGSRKEPTNCCTPISNPVTTKITHGLISQNWRTAIAMGRITAMIDPTTGMKLRKNTSIAQTGA